MTAGCSKVSIELSDYNTFTTLVDRHSLKEETYASSLTSTRNSFAGKLINVILKQRQLFPAQSSLWNGLHLTPCGLQ
jgi:hypothetical protein